MALLARIVVAGLVLVLVFLAAVVGIALIVDPNQFKPGIAQFVRAESGLWPKLDGDLSWSAIPRLGIVAHDVEADGTENPEAPFMSAHRLALEVALRPLVSTNPVLHVERVEIEKSPEQRE